MSTLNHAPLKDSFDQSSSDNFHQILKNTTSPDAFGYSSMPYEDISKHVIIFHSVFAAITLVFLLLRNYSRFFFLRSPGWDDFLLNLAWLATAIMEVIVCVETKYGLGKHIIHVPVDHRIKLMHMIFWYQIMYFIASLFIKSALFVFYLRIAVQTVYKHTCYVLMTLNFCIFIGSLFASIFLCRPVQFFWNRRLEGTCGNVERLYVSNASLNMLMDVAALILPIPIVWGSPSLTKATKIKISALLLLGIVTCVCSILRIIAIRPVTQIGKDFTWKAPQAHKWSTIEIDAAIIAACIPAIKPLIATLLGKATAITGSGGKSKSGSAQKVHDSWVVGSGAGGVTHTSVSAVRNNDGGREHRRVISKGAPKNVDRGEHILLEETLSVNVCGKGQRESAWSSMDSILTAKEEMRRTNTLDDDRENIAGMGGGYK